MSFISICLGLRKLRGTCLIFLLFVQGLLQSLSHELPLQYKNTPPGQPVKQGATLRILAVGDSITVGLLSSDGNGYRERLRNDLSADQVEFVGTERSGTMDDGFYAAWSGKTIQYISDHLNASLAQRPNVILLHAGTNDMNPDPSVSTEGSDPYRAAERLGNLIDKMATACPDATILVAMIINTCLPERIEGTHIFQLLVPIAVGERTIMGKHVLAADFTKYPISALGDCVHPSDDGYRLMGDWWYDFIHQIPKSWIKTPTDLE